MGVGMGTARITIDGGASTASERATMSESTITAKGQTTVPADIRSRIGAAPGTRLIWHAMPDGSVLVRVKSRALLELAGSLKPPHGKRVAVDAMNVWR